MTSAPGPEQATAQHPQLSIDVRLLASAEGHCSAIYPSKINSESSKHTVPREINSLSACLLVCWYPVLSQKRFRIHLSGCATITTPKFQWLCMTKLIFHCAYYMSILGQGGSAPSCFSQGPRLMEPPPSRTTTVALESFCSDVTHIPVSKKKKKFNQVNLKT